jgi:hypothetical protein
MSASHDERRDRDLDLLCWRCRAVLIKDFFALLKLTGPAPVFRELNIPCLSCNTLNHWRLRGSARVPKSAKLRRPEF